MVRTIRRFTTTKARRNAITIHYKLKLNYSNGNDDDDDDNDDDDNYNKLKNICSIIHAFTRSR